jgi:hypothetical protein
MDLADYWFVNWKKFHKESNKAKLITMKIVLNYRRNLKRREVMHQLVRVNENWLIVLEQWELILNVVEFLAWKSFLIKWIWSELMIY